MKTTELFEALLTRLKEEETQVEGAKAPHVADTFDDIETAFAYYKTFVIGGELVELTWDEWVEKYQPEIHPHDAGEAIKVYSPACASDLNLIRAQDPRKVWTLCGEGSLRHIKAGICSTDRLGFYICATPVTHFNLQVTPQ